MAIIVASFTATLAGPIDFLLDTNAVAFIGMFTVLAGLALPVVAIRAGLRRKQSAVQEHRPRPANAAYYTKSRFSSAKESQDKTTIENEIAILRPDQYGINRASTGAGKNQQLRAGGAHPFMSGHIK